MNKLLDHFINEDDGNKNGKDLLCKSCDITDEKAPFCSHSDGWDDSNPQAYPHSHGQKFYAIGRSKLQIIIKSYVIMAFWIIQIKNHSNLPFFEHLVMDELKR